MQKVRREDLKEFVQGVLAMPFLGRLHRQATIIALSGNLGAGKTTFVQTLAKELGIAETVQSPTYVLMKSYPISFLQFTKLVHIDAYRLEKPEEFVTLKPQEFLEDPQCLVVVEWPEKLEGVLPNPLATLKFSSDDTTEAERYIEIV